MSHFVIGQTNGNPFQSLQSDSVYEIVGDIDLNGGTIDLSERPNCVFRFSGGVLRNCTIKANKLLIECGATQCFENVVFDNYKDIIVNNDVEHYRFVSADEMVKNDFVDIRWWGIYPKNALQYKVTDDSGTRSGFANFQDCTPIIRDFIMKLQKPIKFPVGRFYFSEFLVNNVPSEKFALIGEDSYGLGFKTEFYPIEHDQRYIIKIGGGADCLGKENDDIEQRGYNIKIEHIAFRWISSTTRDEYIGIIMGFSNRPVLSNNYYPNETIDYPRSALILDRVQVGKFDISGGELVDIPLLTIGFVYECLFENIIMYVNEGKSDLPVIQVINGVEASVSSCVIRRVMLENVVGPLIKTHRGSSISELVINDFFFEQTASGTYSIGENETRYNDMIADIDLYTRVPCFDFNGYGTLLINNLIFSCVNATWYNQYDHTVQSSSNTMADDGEGENLGDTSLQQDRIRGFVRYGYKFSNYTNLYIKCFCNSMKSRYAYVEGGYERGSQRIIIDRQVGTEIIPVISQETTEVGGDTIVQTIYPHINSPYKERGIYLETGILYSGNKLVGINAPYMMQNYGYNGVASYENEVLLNYRYNSVILSEEGIRFDDSVNYLELRFYTMYQPEDNHLYDAQARITYYDEVEQVQHTSGYVNNPITHNLDLRTIVIPIYRANDFSFSFVKIEIISYNSKIRSILARVN